MVVAVGNAVTADDILAWLKCQGTAETVAGMTRYGIPNDRAFGVPMGMMKAHAKRLEKDHALAGALWQTGWYEARTIAVFLDVPGEVTSAQMDDWAADFDSWAICDTACFHLFDRTVCAWEKVPVWAADPREFVRRAGFALVWSLSTHDKQADDATFRNALRLIETSEPDERPLVNKAIDMALRAVGKRNAALNQAAIDTARMLASRRNKPQSWIGRHALRELESEKVQARLRS